MRLCGGWRGDVADTKAISVAVDSALVERIAEEAAAWDAIADTLDGWAQASRNGGWSTHQVEANEREANAARRRAAGLRRIVANFREASR